MALSAPGVSLPPHVDGALRGALTLTVQSRVEGAGASLCAAEWWGLPPPVDGPAHVFGRDMTFALRAAPRDVGAYLRDMGALPIAVELSSPPLPARRVYAVLPLGKLAEVVGACEGLPPPAPASAALPHPHPFSSMSIPLSVYASKADAERCHAGGESDAGVGSVTVTIDVSFGGDGDIFDAPPSPRGAQPNDESGAEAAFLSSPQSFPAARSPKAAASAPLSPLALPKQATSVRLEASGAPAFALFDAANAKRNQLLPVAPPASILASPPSAGPSVVSSLDATLDTSLHLAFSEPELPIPSFSGALAHSGDGRSLEPSIQGSSSNLVPIAAGAGSAAPPAQSALSAEGVLLPPLLSPFEVDEVLVAHDVANTISVVPAPVSTAAMLAALKGRTAAGAAAASIKSRDKPTPHSAAAAPPSRRPGTATSSNASAPLARPAAIASAATLPAAAKKPQGTSSGAGSKLPASARGGVTSVVAKPTPYDSTAPPAASIAVATGADNALAPSPNFSATDDRTFAKQPQPHAVSTAVLASTSLLATSEQGSVGADASANSGAHVVRETLLAFNYSPQQPPAASAASAAATAKDGASSAANPLQPAALSASATAGPPRATATAGSGAVSLKVASGAGPAVSSPFSSSPSSSSSSVPLPSRPSPRVDVAPPPSAAEASAIDVAADVASRTPALEELLAKSRAALARLDDALALETGADAVEAKAASLMPSAERMQYAATRRSAAGAQLNSSSSLSSLSYRFPAGSQATAAADALAASATTGGAESRSDPPLQDAWLAGLSLDGMTTRGTSRLASSTLPSAASLPGNSGSSGAVANVLLGQALGDPLYSTMAGAEGDGFLEALVSALSDGDGKTAAAAAAGVESTGPQGASLSAAIAILLGEKDDEESHLPPAQSSQQQQPPLASSEAAPLSRPKPLASIDAILEASAVEARLLSARSAAADTALALPSLGPLVDGLRRFGRGASLLHISFPSASLFPGAAVAAAHDETGLLGGMALLAVDAVGRAGGVGAGAGGRGAPKPPQPQRQRVLDRQGALALQQWLCEASSAGGPSVDGARSRCQFVVEYALPPLPASPPMKDAAGALAAGTAMSISCVGTPGGRVGASAEGGGNGIAGSSMRRTASFTAAATAAAQSSPAPKTPVGAGKAGAAASESLRRTPVADAAGGASKAHLSSPSMPPQEFGSPSASAPVPLGCLTDADVAVTLPLAHEHTVSLRRSGGEGSGGALGDPQALSAWLDFELTVVLYLVCPLAASSPSPQTGKAGSATATGGKLSSAAAAAAAAAASSAAALPLRRVYIGHASMPLRQLLLGAPSPLSHAAALEARSAELLAAAASSPASSPSPQPLPAPTHSLNLGGSIQISYQNRRARVALASAASAPGAAAPAPAAATLTASAAPLAARGPYPVRAGSEGARESEALVEARQSAWFSALDEDSRARVVAFHERKRSAVAASLAGASADAAGSKTPAKSGAAAAAAAAASAIPETVAILNFNLALYSTLPPGGGSADAAAPPTAPASFVSILPAASQLQPPHESPPSSFASLLASRALAQDELAPSARPLLRLSEAPPAPLTVPLTGGALDALSQSLSDEMQQRRSAAAALQTGARSAYSYAETASFGAKIEWEALRDEHLAGVALANGLYVTHLCACNGSSLPSAASSQLALLFGGGRGGASGDGSLHGRLVRFYTTLPTMGAAGSGSGAPSSSSAPLSVSRIVSHLRNARLLPPLSSASSAGALEAGQQEGAASLRSRAAATLSVHADLVSARAHLPILLGSGASLTGAEPKRAALAAIAEDARAALDSGRGAPPPPSRSQLVSEEQRSLAAALACVNADLGLLLTLRRVVFEASDEIRDGGSQRDAFTRSLRVLVDPAAPFAFFCGSGSTVEFALNRPSASWSRPREWQPSIASPTVTPAVSSALQPPVAALLIADSSAASTAKSVPETSARIADALSAEGGAIVLELRLHPAASASPSSSSLIPPTLVGTGFVPLSAIAQALDALRVPLCTELLAVSRAIGIVSSPSSTAVPAPLALHGSTTPLVPVVLGPAAGGAEAALGARSGSDNDIAVPLCDPLSGRRIGTAVLSLSLGQSSDALVALGRAAAAFRIGRWAPKALAALLATRRAEDACARNRAARAEAAARAKAAADAEAAAIKAAADAAAAATAALSESGRRASRARQQQVSAAAADALARDASARGDASAYLSEDVRQRIRAIGTPAAAEAPPPVVPLVGLSAPFNPWLATRTAAASGAISPPLLPPSSSNLAPKPSSRAGGSLRHQIHFLVPLSVKDAALHSTADAGPSPFSGPVPPLTLSYSLPGGSGAARAFETAWSASNAHENTSVVHTITLPWRDGADVVQDLMRHVIAAPTEGLPISLSAPGPSGESLNSAAALPLSDIAVLVESAWSSMRNSSVFFSGASLSEGEEPSPDKIIESTVTLRLPLAPDALPLNRSATLAQLPLAVYYRALFVAPAGDAPLEPAFEDIVLRNGDFMGEDEPAVEASAVGASTYLGDSAVAAFANRPNSEGYEAAAASGTSLRSDSSIGGAKMGATPPLKAASKADAEPPLPAALSSTASSSPPTLRAPSGPFVSAFESGLVGGLSFFGGGSTQRPVSSLLDASVASTASDADPWARPAPRIDDPRWLGHLHARKQTAARSAGSVHSFDAGAALPSAPKLALASAATGVEASTMRPTPPAAASATAAFSATEPPTAPPEQLDSTNDGLLADAATRLRGAHHEPTAIDVAAHGADASGGAEERSSLVSSDALLAAVASSSRPVVPQEAAPTTTAALSAEEDDRLFLEEQLRIHGDNDDDDAGGGDSNGGGGAAAQSGSPLPWDDDEDALPLPLPSVSSSVEAALPWDDNEDALPLPLPSVSSSVEASLPWDHDEDEVPSPLPSVSIELRPSSSVAIALNVTPLSPRGNFEDAEAPAGAAAGHSALDVLQPLDDVEPERPVAELLHPNAAPSEDTPPGESVPHAATTDADDSFASRTAAGTAVPSVAAAAASAMHEHPHSQEAHAFTTNANGVFQRVDTPAAVETAGGVTHSLTSQASPPPLHAAAASPAPQLPEAPLEPLEASEELRGEGNLALGMSESGREATSRVDFPSDEELGEFMRNVAVMEAAEAGDAPLNASDSSISSVELQPQQQSASLVTALAAPASVQLDAVAESAGDASLQALASHATAALPSEAEGEEPLPLGALSTEDERELTELVGMFYSFSGSNVGGGRAGDGGIAGRSGDPHAAAVASALPVAAPPLLIAGPPSAPEPAPTKPASAAEPVTVAPAADVAATTPTAASSVAPVAPPPASGSVESPAPAPPLLPTVEAISAAPLSSEALLPVPAEPAPLRSEPAPSAEAPPSSVPGLPQLPHAPVTASAASAAVATPAPSFDASSAPATVAMPPPVPMNVDVDVPGVGTISIRFSQPQLHQQLQGGGQHAAPVVSLPSLAGAASLPDASAKSLSADGGAAASAASLPAAADLAPSTPSAPPVNPHALMQAVFGSPLGREVVDVLHPAASTATKAVEAPPPTAPASAIMSVDRLKRVLRGGADLRGSPQTPPRPPASAATAAAPSGGEAAASSTLRSSQDAIMMRRMDASTRRLAHILSGL